MSLLKKRFRATAAEHEPLTTSTTSSVAAAAPPPTLEGVNLLFASAMDQIQSTGAVPDARATVLQLGQWQRRLYETLAQQDAEIATHTARRKKARRAHMATAYERAHLARQIAQCRLFPMPHLEQLAREETGRTTADPAATDARQLLIDFLGPEVHDPRRKADVIARLQDCLKQRAVLEKDVLIQKQALLKTQLELKAQRAVLRSLPAHLQAVERAAQGLVKLLSSPSSGNGDSDSPSFQHMTGTERFARLELARRLPPPLYALYSLLQHAVDERSGPGGGATAATTASDLSDGITTTTTTMRVLLQKDTVVWQLPVTEVGTSSTKKKLTVSVHFVYTPPAVLVHATGCATTLNQEVLLEELFPGDCALDLYSSSPSHPAATTTTAAPGKSYQWSNHLAGLYPVPSSPALARYGRGSTATTETATATTTATTTDAVLLLNVSAGVVVRELPRRIRANATLQHILYSLQRRHVPVPPPAPANRVSAVIASHRVPWKPVCKLVRFDPASENRSAPSHPDYDHGSSSNNNGVDAAATTPLTIYAVELRHGQQSLLASVRVHPARYPAVPPVWTFFPPTSTESAAAAATTASATNARPSPLYDPRLARLAQRVNVEALNRGTAKATRTVAHIDDDKADDDPLHYYEWILVHQLRDVMLEWDATCAKNNDSSSGIGGLAAVTAVGRTHKGRDRRAVEE